MLQFNCMELILFNCVFQLNQYKNVRCLFLDTCVGGRGCPPIVLFEQRVHDPKVLQVGAQARNENHQKEQERHVLWKKGLGHQQTWCQFEVNGWDMFSFFREKIITRYDVNERSKEETCSLNWRTYHLMQQIVANNQQYFSKCNARNGCDCQTQTIQYKNRLPEVV